MIAHPIVAALALTAVFTVNLAYAQVNRCQDASGKVIYSDKPCASGQRGGQIERAKTQDEIYSERVQAYEAENRKQERALVAQQRQAQQQSGPELLNQQAPVVRHSGNDWATRKALENAATSAGSITNNGGKWDRAAEAERSRVRQEEARRRAAEEERARAAAAPKPKPTAITRCYGYNCHDDQGGTYNRATGDSNLMIGPDGKQCRRIYPSQDWQCN